MAEPNQNKEIVETLKRIEQLLRKQVERLESPLVVTVREAGRLIHRSATDVYTMIRAKRLPAFKYSDGGDWLIERAALEEWIEQTAQQWQEDNPHPNRLRR